MLVGIGKGRKELLFIQQNLLGLCGGVGVQGSKIIGGRQLLTGTTHGSFCV